MQQEQINQILQAEKLNQKIEELARDLSEMKEDTASIRKNVGNFMYSSDGIYKLAAWCSIISSISVVTVLGYLVYVAYKLKFFEKITFLMDMAN